MTRSNAAHASPSVIRALWLLVIVLFSTLVAVCVGALKHATGTRFADVVLCAGNAFGATAGLCFGAVGAVAVLRSGTAGNADLDTVESERPVR
ncbi:MULTISPECIES: hypothetical protein [Streptomyces]|uniref:Uncharacterized protein n=1 Tax=Streptomyces sudanensis TaxID=436397 RepID=A0ABY4TDF9_9ACTN|nr:MULTISPECIES: hypothetical protein [Streptomyces]MCP9958090.1 hypothetical protein [Streptomyces sudanensis]MCQ0001387.1 hypothetical protein [Streptomyces sudanensis]URN16986.1 hypothetical protein MW084_14790 [Streptomyces sudanensis]